MYAAHEHADGARRTGTGSSWPSPTTCPSGCSPPTPRASTSRTRRELFAPEALAEYQRCLRDPRRDPRDLRGLPRGRDVRLRARRGRSRHAPDRLPGARAVGRARAASRRYDVLAIWRDVGDDVRGAALDCGHHLPEEAPEETSRRCTSSCADIIRRAMADRETEIRARAEELLAEMTPAEKAGQLSQYFYFGVAAGDRRGLSVGGLPSEASRGGRGGARARRGRGRCCSSPTRREINRLQRLAVEGNRLGIPALFGFDVIHGLRTILPVPIAMAASWDPDDDRARAGRRRARGAGRRHPLDVRADGRHRPRPALGAHHRGRGRGPVPRRRRRRRPGARLPGAGARHARARDRRSQALRRVRRRASAGATTTRSTSPTPSCGTSTSRRSRRRSRPAPATS